MKLERIMLMVLHRGQPLDPRGSLSLILSRCQFLCLQDILFLG